MTELRLVPGTTFGIVSPAFAAQSDLVEAGVRRLELWGFKVRLFLPPGPQGRLAAPDSMRLAALLAALEDPEIGAVLATCGGYGSTRIVEDVPPALWRRSAKPIIGYSDVTALLLAAHAAGGLAVHGPMLEEIGRGLDPVSEAAFLSLLFGDAGGYRNAAKGIQLRCLRPGRVSAEILGGNLAILSSLAGTPLGRRVRPAVLFLEDCNEALYRVDRMLMQLRQNGLFETCKAVILGEFTNISGCEDLPETIAERILHLSGTAPVLDGFPAGHGGGQFPFRLGATVSIEGEGLLLDL